MDTTPSFDNLQVIPYVPGLAEYAGIVREEIRRRKDSDFVLAIDLPKGLEGEVLGAVKRLPEISLIIDILMRGIPIVPTSAPIEAVRSFHEYGYEMKFLDVSLPVIGNLREYHDFLELCHVHGLEKVLEAPAQYGIPEGDLVQSWKELFNRGNQKVPFPHHPRIATGVGGLPFSPDDSSPYLNCRLQCMAMHLKELLETEIDTLLVCSTSQRAGILYYLGSEIPPIDDSCVVPCRTGVVGESDVFSLTTEIPFMMYLYELFRDTPVQREKWIEILYCEADRSGHAPDMIRSTIEYALQLALTDQDLFPSIYNLVAAAKFVVDDDYAFRVFDLARSYPPARSSNPTIAVKKVFDYNFQSLQDTRSLTLIPSLLEQHRRPRFQSRRTRKTGWKFVHYSRWYRTQDSYRAEREFMKYVTSRFAHYVQSNEEYVVSEFTGSLGDGVDIRETIRNRGWQRLYVREPEKENLTCYIFDYRKFHGGNEGNTNVYNSPIFLDRYSPWIGLTQMRGNHYTSGVMVAFTSLPFSPTKIFGSLKGSNPLCSAVTIGLEHARHLMVFTDSPEELAMVADAKDRIHILPCRVIPPLIYRKMSEFDITHTRFDDKRGD